MKAGEYLPEIEKCMLYKRAVDMLEDFICGPVDDPEDFKEYLKEREDIRKEREDRFWNFYNNTHRGKRRMMEAFGALKLLSTNVVKTLAKARRLSDSYGGINDDKEFNDDSCHVKQDVETTGQDLEVMYYFQETCPDILPWADVYTQPVVLFESYQRAAEWYHTRPDSELLNMHYKKYWHSMLGGIRNISNATLMVASHLGFKMLLPEWVTLPADMPEVTQEYADDAEQQMVDLPRVFGFKYVAYDIDTNTWCSVARHRVVEDFFPMMKLDRIPNVPDPPPVPRPPGPTPDSPFGLCVHLQDPPSYGTVPGLPYTWQGHGLCLVSDHHFLDPECVSIIGVKALPEHGVSINPETGGLQVNIGDGCERFPMVLTEDGDVLSAGGVGIEAELVEYIDDANEWLERAADVLEAVECIQKIDSLNPCS